MFKKIALTLVSTLALAGIGLSALYFWYGSGGLQQKVLEKIEEKIKTRYASSTVDSNVLEEIMGFNETKTYLVLFLNNTELRPAGGFIGVYAVVQLDKGVPKILKVEGTEILDNYAPRDFVSVPPDPLKKYLLVPRWELRDSNWSPDFASSSQKALELYKLENGLAADQIDAVIGFTPTVIEEILRINGPIKYDGMEFTADNFTEKLEYEVEYGYKTKGLSFNDRKQILVGLTKDFARHLSVDVFLHWSDYSQLIERMIKEKQIMAYTDHAKAQAVIEAKDLGGRVKDYGGDFVMWVDANLGAWKTDASLDRRLSYQLARDSQGRYVATVTMKYVHQGVFDWRTSRYRTYARLYVPLGSKFISVQGSLEREQSTVAGTVDQGVEFGKQWFGTFTAVEPGTTRELVWKFYPSAEVAKQIEQGTYKLFVQKQLGTVKTGLTLGLDFAKDIESASPGEEQAKHGDQRYDYTTDLTLDREFTVKFK